MPEFGSISDALHRGDRVYDWRDPDRIGTVVEVIGVAGNKFLPLVVVAYDDGEKIRLPVTRWKRDLSE